MQWLIGLFLIEFFLNILIKGYRKSFAWLIIEKDSRPTLDPAGLKKFLAGGYDPDLGWVRKPNSGGTERRGAVETRYTIDGRGCRSDQLRSDTPQVAVFGDSYAFCRQVDDQETWEHYLGNDLGVDVLNFGVGNYGADQALLRFEREPLPDSVQVAVLAFVPETICRVLSYWKHYLEFGNTFAFKPRFVMRDGELELVPNAMGSPGAFNHYEDELATIQANDFFYEYKFRELQFRLPYTVSFFRNPVRNARLVASLIKRTLCRFVGKTSPAIEDGPFFEVMRFNTHQAFALYEKEEAANLLRAILLRFAATARQRGQEPLVLVLPQLTDMRLSPERRRACEEFFRNLDKDVPTIDGACHLPQDSLENLYTSDQYGGHFSPAGNRVVAEMIRKPIKEMLEKGR